MRTALLVLISLLAVGVVGCATQDDAATVAAVRKEATAWLDSLELADLKGAKFIRIATGRSYRTGGGPWRNTYDYGFLLGQDGVRFTALTWDMAIKTHEYTPPDHPEHQRVGYDELDPKKFVAKCLTKSRSKHSRWGPEGWRGGPRLSDVRALVLAWACERNGLPEQALALAACALKQHGERVAESNRTRLIEDFKDEVARTVLVGAHLRLADDQLSRAEQLAAYEHWLKRFPKADEHERAQTAVAVLRGMIKEQEAWDKKPRKPLDEMTVREKIAELIFNLREQDGSYSSMMAAFYPHFFGQDDFSPADRLARMGFAAVPQLLEHINDTTFTRTSGSASRFRFRCATFTVGRCVEAILERIAARDFDFPYHMDPREGHASRERVHEWWKQIREKGEKQVLVEAVSLGGSSARPSAVRLVSTYPDAAPDAIMSGIKADKKGRIRADLISTLSTLKAEAIGPFLRKELIEAPNMDARAAAARGLLQRGDNAAIKVMIDHWNAPRCRIAEKPRDTLIHFLASCRHPDAIRALCTDLAQRNVATRLEVVEALGQALTDRTWPWLKSPQAAMTDAQRKQGEALAEEALLAAMADDARRVNLHWSTSSISVSAPAIREMAAHQLSQTWPNRYEFDWNASVAKRERQILQITNH